MKFKEDRIEIEFERAPLMLQLVMEDFDKISKIHCGQEAIVTRILGKIDGDSGVHADHRAADFRDEFEGGRLYTEEQVKFLVQYMNSMYQRNDGKLTMIHHSFNGGPLHFHVQIATLTKTYMP